MFPAPSVEIKSILQTLNSLCEIERKLATHGDPGNVRRNIERIKESMEAAGFFYEDPMDQSWNETRTDLDASIAGSRTEDLIVVEVIKPIVRFGERSLSRVIQKGVVIVRSKSEK